MTYFKLLVLNFIDIIPRLIDKQNKALKLPTANTYFVLFFIFSTESRKHNVSIKAPVGELLQPITLPEKEFLTQQGKIRKHLKKFDVYNFNI